MRKLALLFLMLFGVAAHAQQRVPINSGVVSINTDQSQRYFKITLNQNVTTFTFQGAPVAGAPLTIIFTQDATGGRTVAGYDANIVTTQCSISTVASATTICLFSYDSTSATWNATAMGGGGSATPNNPIPQGNVGPGFNVLNYGVVNDAQSLANCSLNGTTTVSCAGAGFCNGGSVACAAGQKSNVGMEFSCGLIFAGAYGSYVPKTTIVSVTNSTTIVAGAAAIATQSNASCAWGSPSAANDTAAQTAVNAWLAAIHGINSLGLVGAPPVPAVLYFPSGGYLFCNFSLTVPTNKDGWKITGDIHDSTQLIWEPGCTQNQGAAPIDVASNATNGEIDYLTLNGIGGVQANSANSAFRTNGSVVINNVNIQGLGVAFGLNAGGTVYTRGVTVKNNNGVGMLCNQCGGDIDTGILSNNAQNNLSIQNVVGLNTGLGFRVGRGQLVDETGNAAFPPTKVVNSHDVWFIGPGLFSTSSGNALSVDGTSFIHFVGGIVGVFGNDSNAGGVTIAAGGQLQASDTRFVSTGTGKCITNSGSFNDNGGNTCESMFPIASGTSTGTTAVLTLTTLGANVNTNCSAGDALLVEGASIAGYNGYFAAGSAITAATATTLTYTTQGSNLGALGAGGVAFCRNLQTFSGTLPRALLNNPIPNTCYITGAFAATTTALPMCNFRTQSATNITRILASSTTVTACTVAPVVTITDGTVTWTLTLTTAKSQWDSAVDTSTGVGTTIAKPNGTVTLSNTAGTCTTPPTNFSVSYNIAPILSN